jgi:hypothetical protein
MRTARPATRKPKLFMMVSLRASLAPDELGAWTGRSILGQSRYESIARKRVGDVC